MRRILVFVVLLALGLLALRIAIGDDTVVTAGDTKQQPKQDTEDRTPAVVVQQGRIGAAISQNGYFKWPRYRTVLLPDGSSRDELVYVMEAANSRPVREGLQELEDLQVTMFDRQQPAAQLTAARAFVELATDANGHPSVREDKDIDMRQVVFKTLPGARLEGLQLQLENAKLLVGEDEILLHTPNASDPVVLTLTGERSGRLTGNGLQARLPRSRSAKSQHADVTILSNPLVVTDGMQLRADGRLHYQEDTVSGAAQMTVEDNVDAELQPRATDDLRAERKLEIGTVRMRGDRFVGWLQRGKQRDEQGEEHERMEWQLLQISGAPARVTATGTDLHAPRLTVIAGLSGQPYLIAAHGGAARVEQRDFGPDSKVDAPVVATSPRRIHLILPREQTVEMLRGFGFPLAALRPLATTQIATLDGDSKIATGTASATASKGMQMFRPGDTGRGAIARGFGEVDIDRPATKPGEDDLHATGNDGFLLRANDDDERFWLGPLAGSSTDLNQHRYVLRSAAGELRGSGSCAIERTASGTRVALDSPAGDIQGDLPQVHGSLQQVSHLSAHLTADSLRNLVATGRPMRVHFTRGVHQVQALAQRIEQLGPTSWVLLPAKQGAIELPELVHSSPADGKRGSERVVLRAPRIELHHCGGDNWLLDLQAQGDVPAHADAAIELQPGAVPTLIELDAQRLRLLPFLLPPEARLAHGAGAALATSLSMHGLGSAWILGEDVRRLHITDPEQGQIEGAGRRLLLSQGAQAAVLFGDDRELLPAWLRRTQGDRVVEARGAQVRIFRDEQIRLQALRSFPGRSVFLPPSVTLHQPSAGNNLRDLHAVCQGDIDVLPERIDFRGPVITNSLREDGQIDPFGLHIDARQLAMQRHPTTGEITMVRGQDVFVEWSGITAKSAQIELDVRNSRCRATDPNEAQVVLPGGERFMAPSIEIFYDRFEVRCFNSRFTRDDRDAISPR